MHKDHYSDLSAIGYASYVYHNLGYLNNKVKIYIPNDNNLEDYKYLINYGNENYIDFYTYDENSCINIDETSINFYKTYHPIKTYAMNVIKHNLKISYSADTGYDENITNFF